MTTEDKTNRIKLKLKGLIPIKYRNQALG